MTPMSPATDATAAALANTGSPAVYQVVLERIGTGVRGDRWRVTYAGIVIVESSKVPEFDAARYFTALGLTGILETRHAGSAIVSMRLDIETAARLTVIENEKIGPKLGRWRPFDLTQRLGTPIAESTSCPTA